MNVTKDEYDLYASLNGIRRPRTQQAIVRINSHPHTNDIFNRISDAKDDVDGSVIPGQNLKLFRIEIGDICWAWKSDLKMRGFEYPPVFSSLNAITHKGYQTSESLQREMEVVGIAITPHHFNRTDDALQDLALQRRGSYTIINKGGNKIRHGDKLMFVVPPFNKYEGVIPNAEWVRKVSGGDDNEQRLVAHVKVFHDTDVEDANRSMFYDVAKLLNDSKIYPMNKYFDKLVSSSKKNLESEEVVAIGKTLTSLCHFVHGLQVFGAYGMITINDPQEMLDKEIMETALKKWRNGEYLSDKEQDKIIKALQLNEKNPTNVNQCNHMFYVNGKAKKLENKNYTKKNVLREMSKEQKIKLQEKIKWIMVRLGMISAKNKFMDDSEFVNTNWIQEYVLHLNSNYIPSEKKLTKQFYSPHFYGASDEKSDCSSQAMRLLRDCQEIESQITLRWYKNEIDNVHAIALSSSDPGEELDILLIDGY